jgi:hypothetical protein
LRTGHHRTHGIGPQNAVSAGQRVAFCLVDGWCPRRVPPNMGTAPDQRRR